ncbi:MAG: efflux RND transporter periplasmic adaptor subunit [Pseudomonadota bacterium]
MPIRLQAIALVAIVAVGAGMWFGRDLLPGVDKNAQKSSKKANKKNTKRGVPVIVTYVTQANDDTTIAAVGTARARRSVMIRAKSDGVIMDFRTKAGQRLSKGDLIFELDSRQAELAAEIAAKKVTEAERQLARVRRLNKRKVNSDARVADAEIALDRAKLEQLQAKKVLSDLKIVAPFSGIVGLPKAEVGDRVTSTTPIVSFDMRRELLVEFQVPERYSARIKSGKKIAATTPSYERRKFSGHVEYIDSRVDPTSRTVAVRAIIPNTDDLLRPGMSFAVEINLLGKGHAVVPELSLQWRKGESYVWLVRDQKARKTLVTTIRRRNGIVLVDGNISSRDLVVTEGVQRLRDGRKVFYDAPQIEPVETDPVKRSARDRDASKG